MVFWVGWVLLPVLGARVQVRLVVVGGTGLAGAKVEGPLAMKVKFCRVEPAGQPL